MVVCHANYRHRFVGRDLCALLYVARRSGPRFFSFLLSFMGSMLGVVLSGNIVLLAVFWELTSIFSFLLIGYWYHNASARDGARMALTVTGIGGFCLMAGVLLLGHIVGSYDLDKVLEAGNVVRTHPLYTVTLVLILMAALQSRHSFRFISGCRMRWRHRRQYQPICILPRWLKRVFSCWRVCGLSFLAQKNGSGYWASQVSQPC